MKIDPLRTAFVNFAEKTNGVLRRHPIFLSSVFWSLSLNLNLSLNFSLFVYFLFDQGTKG